MFVTRARVLSGKPDHQDKPGHLS